ncbi:hypothetical protein [Archangium lansingense]|uniref:Uncharacterized protein n=1 Tax=Archangium lansingense TaxID=2995310 RepID=A0ABT3ZWQ6_9BACT|nr:hypothetical protein [Archangium lansinium]MCY1073815.1 hypothetical protein [Archangium lansinium]
MPQKAKFGTKALQAAKKAVTLEFTADDRPGTGPGVPGNVPPLSNHHILSQRYMQLIFRIKEFKGEADYFRRFTNINAMTWKNTATNKLAEWVWTPYNLFQGPTGQYRTDDPKSGIEQTKPHGLDGARWVALKMLAYTLFKHVKEDKLLKILAGEKVKFEVTDELHAELNRWLQAFHDAITEAHGNYAAYGFAGADWAQANGRYRVHACNCKGCNATTHTLAKYQK